MTRGRRIGWAGAATIVLLLLHQLTLGIAGAIVIEGTAGLLAPLGAASPTGDAAWPAAILVAAVMPFGVLISALVLARVRPDAGAAQSWLWGAASYLGIGFLAALFLVFQPGK